MIFARHGSWTSISISVFYLCCCGLFFILPSESQSRSKLKAQIPPGEGKGWSAEDELDQQIEDDGRLGGDESQNQEPVVTTSPPKNKKGKPAKVDTANQNRKDDKNEPLILTPYIRKGKLEIGRNLARDVMHLPHVESPIFGNITSYSGFFTVNESCNSNLFFWFFPSLEDSENAPIFLWINERVGVSSLQGTFVKNGPFYVDKTGLLQERKHTWVRKLNMLYIDSPVGAGFSFTDKEDGYSNNAVEEATGMYEALLQFFTLFPEYRRNDFYLSGETYAGVFIPLMTLKIHEGNKATQESLKINLKGMTMGSPYIDSMLQLQWSEYLFGMGLIDEHQLVDMRDGEKKLLSLLERGKWTDVSKVTAEISGAFPNSFYRNFTGLADCRNVMVAEVPEEVGNFLKFVNKIEVHEYLHVSKQNFTYFNSHVRQHFFQTPGAILKPDKVNLEKVLDLGYQVLIYGGQFDGLITHIGLTKVVHSLRWNNSELFLKTPRKIWSLNKTVAGYFQGAANLIYMVLRNAGNLASVDQPERVLKMMESFTGSDDDW